MKSEVWFVNVKSLFLYLASAESKLQREKGRHPQIGVLEDCSCNFV